MLGRRSFLSFLGIAPVVYTNPVNRAVGGGGVEGYEAFVGEAIKPMPAMLESFDLSLNAGDIRTIISDLMTKMQVKFVEAIEDDRDRPFRFETWEGNYKDWGV